MARLLQALRRIVARPPSRRFIPMGEVSADWLAEHADVECATTGWEDGPVWRSPAEIERLRRDGCETAAA